MTSLDADAILDCLPGDVRKDIGQLQAFATIDSTNTYLMQAPGPSPGQLNIAATSNQLAGRGREGKSWHTPPGSGVCLSAAYTFPSQPENLPALTLAIGLAALTALKGLGATGIQIKWPNDLVARGGKLGGILTEVQSSSSKGVTVVCGIGINVDLGEEIDTGMRSDWAKGVVDLYALCRNKPSYDEVAAALITQFSNTFREYELDGFAPLVARWSQHDWLVGRDLIVQSAQQEIRGIGAGIAEDGALLVETRANGTRHVVSGTIVHVGPRDSM
ncbi:MAG TPA: biotin--[acetyl-CoA-carboxylase] ligase [Woeseiaceae bacterium]|nr:biotin--[acetyl-CoA-carboxylase] ligase [Woeseiaceae bacterium]